VIQLWEVKTRQRRATLIGHTEVPYYLAFTPDGRTLATASWDSTVRLWHVATGQPLITLEGHRGALYSVAFSSDGATMASAGGYFQADSKVRSGDMILWHTATPEEVEGRRNAAGPEVQLKQTVTLKSSPFAPPHFERMVAAAETHLVEGRAERSMLIARVGLLRLERLQTEQRLDPRFWIYRGRFHHAGGEDDVAVADFSAALAQSGNTETARILHQYRADANVRMGLHRQALEDYDRMGELAGTDANFLNNLAWHLATAGEPALRDPARAVRWASEAVSLKPEVRSYQNTLGVARYRAGEYQAAISALETSMKLGGGGDSFDWFILAMVYCQLGDIDEARRWQGRAIEWMDSQTSADDELLRFRAEAEELLSKAFAAESLKGRAAAPPGRTP
jgi:tetratricopeptide (TPR) repeat protein